MIALDTNLLVYAHRRDSPFYAKAAELIAGLASSSAAWAIPWPCLHEFYGVATSARVFRPPSTIEQALSQIEAWLDAPTVVLLHEGTSHWPALQRMIIDAKIIGPMVHDARIAALCMQHGVRELWSADRDFNRFPKLVVRNPLVG